MLSFGWFFPLVLLRPSKSATVYASSWKLYISRRAKKKEKKKKKISRFLPLFDVRIVRKFFEFFFSRVVFPPEFHALLTSAWLKNYNHIFRSSYSIVYTRHFVQLFRSHCELISPYVLAASLVKGGFSFEAFQLQISLVARAKKITSMFSFVSNERKLDVLFSSENTTSKLPHNSINHRRIWKTLKMNEKKSRHKIIRVDFVISPCAFHNDTIYRLLCSTTRRYSFDGDNFHFGYTSSVAIRECFYILPAFRDKKIQPVGLKVELRALL